MSLPVPAVPTAGTPTHDVAPHDSLPRRQPGPPRTLGQSAPHMACPRPRGGGGGNDSLTPGQTALPPVALAASLGPHAVAPHPRGGRGPEPHARTHRRGVPPLAGFSARVHAFLDTGTPAFDTLAPAMGRLKCAAPRLVSSLAVGGRRVAHPVSPTRDERRVPRSSRLRIFFQSHAHPRLCTCRGPAAPVDGRALEGERRGTSPGDGGSLPPRPVGRAPAAPAACRARDGERRGTSPGDRERFAPTTSQRRGPAAPAASRAPEGKRRGTSPAARPARRAPLVMSASCHGAAWTAEERIVAEPRVPPRAFASVGTGCRTPQTRKNSGAHLHAHTKCGGSPPGRAVAGLDDYRCYYTAGGGDDHNRSGTRRGEPAGGGPSQRVIGTSQDAPRP